MADWDSVDWQLAVNEWVREEVGHQGRRVLGDVEWFHKRPWSMVGRAATDRGNVIFKVASSVFRFEAGLTEYLYGQRPDCIVPLLAVKPERGWMLMPDLEAPIRGSIQSRQDLEHWRRILRIYTGLQVEMAQHLPRLLELGIMDRRLATLPDQVNRLLEDREILQVGLAEGVSEAEYKELQKLMPRFIEMCAELGSYNIPETLQHDDFHDANIFYQDGLYLFADWAESCAAHPFFSMVVTPRAIAYRLGLEPDDLALEELKQIYLEAWEGFERPERLQEAYRLAQVVGAANRALTWYRVVSTLEGEAKEAEKDAVPGWMGEYVRRMKAAPQAKNAS